MCPSVRAACVSVIGSHFTIQDFYIITEYCLSVHTPVLSPNPKPARSQKIRILYRGEELRGSCHTGCTQVKRDLSLTEGDSRAQGPAGILLSLAPPEPSPALPLLPPAQPRQEGQLRTRQAQQGPAQALPTCRSQSLQG